MWTLDDVIAAVASPPGAGRRGIVRVAGPGVQRVVAGMILTSTHAVPPNLSSAQARRTETSLIVDGLSTPLPVALFIWPDHRSYAGQPTIEIHTIGSPPILNALLETLVARGARIARPGEFTLRAFLAGKIDLVQAEAVLCVIDAGSTEQLQQALDQLAGGVSARMRALREQLLIDLADLEAGLDFVEEDIEFVDRAAMTARLEDAVEWLTRLQRYAHDRGQTTGRQSVVLAGLPNAGKSTLFNALAGREAAMVSPVAGTTRDWLTATVELDGLAFDLVDTAGVEHGSDVISEVAQQMRSERVQHADLVLWCTAADATPEELLLDQDLRSQNLASHEDRRGTGPQRVVTKADQGFIDDGHSCYVSAATGAGLPDLKARLREWLAESGGEGELLSSTIARCGESLSRSLEALSRAREFSSHAGGEELVAFELRRGLESLGEIAGVVYTDDLLDRIFSRFCIGK
ncbi:MAG TPA: tRNA modification GTPase [Caulifigura sp.]|jgi:tRNA modification GTPase|nr:tRNA modification GTPase [Caulifigura sp.]